MTEAQARKIFEKYNPVSAVIRCPNGRASVRKLLDTYAKAAINLYGVISVAEFAEIFNAQNTEQTNAGEVFTLLLPLVLKSKSPWYCFYNGYIVHYIAIDDFDHAKYLIEEQADKPRYIPPKDELLKFESEYYENEAQRLRWEKFLDYLRKLWPSYMNIYRFYDELKTSILFYRTPDFISEMLEEYGLQFDDEDQTFEFFSLLYEARNNTRLWINKGHSPNGLKDILDSSPSDEGPEITNIRQRQKISPNAPCPCGSGKKYKKCCRLIEESRLAQLTYDECALFFETWYGLLGFVNERKKVINVAIKPIYPNPISDEQTYRVREALWEDPALIDDYLATAELPEEKVELLRAWRNHHKKGIFFAVEYKLAYAIVIGSDEQKEDRLYGVKGLSRTLSAMLERELPVQFEAVLLPFKDKIIHDGFVSSLPVGYSAGAKKMFSQMYESAARHGIITSLG